MTRLTPGRLVRAGIALTLALCVAGVLLPARAADMMTPRLQIGVSLLPAVAAANQSLSTANPTVPLPIYVVYRDKRHIAEQLEPGLRKIDTIRNHPVVVSSIHIDEMLASNPGPMSIVFIAENLGSSLDGLIAFGRERRLLLFSPYKGDVERGVAAGFRVTDRVLPMVNMAYLKATNIQLKAFFLRIAVKYE